LNLLPLLREINPSVSESIFETANRLNEVADIYEKVIESGKECVCKEQSVYIKKLMNEPAPQSLLFEILHPLGFNSKQIKVIFENLEKQSGQRYYSEQWEVLKDRETLILTRKNSNNPSESIQKEISIKNGTVDFNGIQLKISIIPYATDVVISKDKQSASLDLDKIKQPLFIRKVKSGDWFVPFGMKGKKLLSDFMTDLKFPLTKKEKQTVVCCGNEIAWVIGERISDHYRIDNATHKILQITVM